MRLHFHIGLNKAGSTYLQDVLSRNVATLERAGFCYPDPQSSGGASGAQRGNAAQFALALGDVDAKVASRELGRFVEVANTRGCNSLVLSSEYALDKVSRPDGIARLRRLSRAKGITEIRMLLVVRDPVAHAISAYCHSVAGKLQPVFDQWLEQGYALPRQIQGLLEWVVGSEGVNIDVVDLADGGPVSIVETWLGVSDLTAPDFPRSNVSINCAEAEVVRRLAHLDQRSAFKLRDSLRELPMSDKADDAQIRLRWEGSAYRYLGRYAEEWDRLAEFVGHRFFPQVPPAAVDAASSSGEAADVPLSGVQIETALKVLTRRPTMRDRAWRLRSRLPIRR